MPIPFTNPWSDNIPSDTQFANLLGGDIRQLRLDISDRMGILFSDWESNQNTLTLLPTAGGAVTGKVAQVPMASWVMNPITNGSFAWITGSGNSYAQVTTAASNIGVVNLSASFPTLLAGVVITQVVIYYDTAGAASVTFSWWQMAPGTTGGTTTSFGSAVGSGVHTGSPQTATLFTGTQTLAGMNWLQISISNSTFVGAGLINIYGASIKYNTPNVQYCV